MTKAMPIPHPVFRPNFPEDVQMRVIDIVAQEAEENVSRRWGNPNHLHFHGAIDRLIILAGEINNTEGFNNNLPRE